MITTGRQITTHTGQVAIATTAMVRQMTTDTGQSDISLGNNDSYGRSSSQADSYGSASRGNYGSRAKTRLGLD
jgi:hypothetical protein